MKLQAASRLLAAERTSPQAKSLERRLDYLREKPIRDRTFNDRRAILNTEEQLQKTKQADRHKREKANPLNQE